MPQLQVALRLLAGWLGLSLPLGIAQTPKPESGSGKEVLVLPEFQVTARSTVDDYIASEATGGTRIGAKIIELPYTVDVLTSDLMRDLQFLDPTEQLALIPGASPGNTDFGVISNARVRGLLVQPLRDGFKTGAPPDIANTTRVEVIKGAQSTLYGRLNLGGLINYISKKPRSEPFYRVEASAGNYAYLRSMAEAGGPLVKDRVFYLLNGSYAYNESDLEFYFSKVYIYSGGLTFRLGPETTLTTTLEQQDAYFDRGTGIPQVLIGSRPVSATNPLNRTGGLIGGSYLPLKHFNQYGPDERVTRHFTAINPQLEHRFDSIWSVRLNYQSYDKTFRNTRWTEVRYVPETGRLSARNPFASDETDQADSAQMDLLAQFGVGRVNHKVLLSADYAQESLDQLQRQLPTAALSALPATMRFLDPANPDWTKVDYSLLTRATIDRVTDTTAYGVMLSDRAFFMEERLVTLAGVRFDSVKLGVDNQLTPGDSGRSTQDGFSSTVGVNYKVLGDRLLVFGSRSTAFDPQTTVDQGTGKPQMSETATGWEFGVKGFFKGEDIAYTVSFFDITRKDISTANPDYTADNAGTGVPQYLGLGEERSRGIDLSLSARLSEAWTLRAGGAYINGEVIASPDTPEYVGDALIGTPSYNTNFLVRYSVTNGALKGLRIGVSHIYSDGYMVNRVSSTRSRVEHGGYALMGGFLNYGWRAAKGVGCSVNLNIKNALDREYLSFNRYLGRGREFRATLTTTF